MIGHHRDPKKHILGRNRTYMVILVEIRPLVRSGLELREPKKKGKERNLQWQTVCSPRPPTLSQRYEVLHARWSSRDRPIVLSLEFGENRSDDFRCFLLLWPVAYCTIFFTLQAVNRDTRESCRAPRTT